MLYFTGSEIFCNTKPAFTYPETWNWSCSFQQPRLTTCVVDVLYCIKMQTSKLWRASQVRRASDTGSAVSRPMMVFWSQVEGSSNLPSRFISLYDRCHPFIATLLQTVVSFWLPNFVLEYTSTTPRVVFLYKVADSFHFLYGFRKNIWVLLR